jgi:hypothetical protein
MKRFYWLATIAVLLAAVALACAGPKNNSSGPNVIVSPETVVLSNAQAAQATIHADNLTFPASGNDNLLKLHAGNVLVSGYVNASSDIHGFLRKVTGVQLDGAQIVIATTSATLLDVFEKANVTFTFPGPSAQAADFFDEPFKDGTMETMGSGSASALMSLDFGGISLYNGGGLDLSVENGNLSFAPEFTYALNIEDNRVKLIDFTATGNFAATFGLRATATAGVNIGFSKTFRTFFTGDWTVWVEFVPIVFTANATASATVLVKGDGAITAYGAVTGFGMITASETYTDTGGWSHKVTQPSISWAGVGPDYDTYVNFDVQGSAGLGIDVRLYDVVGPYFSVGPFLEVSFVKDPVCNYRLDCGLSGTIGANATGGVLGSLVVGDFNTNLFEIRRNLTQGQCCNVKKCPQGCCNIDSVCVPGTSQWECGKNANACVDCLAQNCVNQTCAVDDDDNDDDTDDDDNDDDNDDNDDTDNSGCKNSALQTCIQNAHAIDLTCVKACADPSNPCQQTSCSANCDIQYQNAAIACATKYPCAAAAAIDRCVQACDQGEVGCLASTLGDCGPLQPGSVELITCAFNYTTCVSPCVTDDDTSDDDASDDDDDNDTAVDDDDDTDKCNSNNCAGCCAGTACMAGDGKDACGTDGAACVACAKGQECASNGQGGVCACDWNSCPTGCCGPDASCLPGNTNALCGTGADACLACPAGARCYSGWCICDPISCPTGCCDASGKCQPGDAKTDCGAGGAECISCLQSEECNANRCQES